MGRHWPMPTSINTIGLSAQLYPETGLGTRIPGAFFVFAVGANKQFKWQDLAQAALAFAASRFSGDVAYMVGLIPVFVWDDLVNIEKSCVLDPLGLPGSATAFACLPPSFPTLDKFLQGRWIIVPVGR